MRIVIAGLALAALLAGCTCQMVESRDKDGSSLVVTRVGWGYDGFSPVNIVTNTRTDSERKH